MPPAQHAVMFFLTDTQVPSLMAGLHPGKQVTLTDDETSLGQLLKLWSGQNHFRHVQK